MISARIYLFSNFPNAGTSFLAGISTQNGIVCVITQLTSEILLVSISGRIQCAVHRADSYEEYHDH